MTTSLFSIWRNEKPKQCYLEQLNDYRGKTPFSLLYKDNRYTTLIPTRTLGNELDSTLTLNGNFDRAYKKTSGRLNLLHKMPSYLSVEAAHKIFSRLLYSSLINLQITTTQQRKLQSIERRAKFITGGRININSIEGRMRKKACMIVKQCLTDKVCSNFEKYFTINEHSMNTRNKNKLVKLPLDLEFGKKSFKFLGAEVYNELPLFIRNCEKLANFKILLRQHFSN